jgi:phospholipid/cholesterol/gamma-HCH transport system ATP-binding protein
MPNKIDIQNLHFAIHERPIFRGISMQFPPGKIVAIMGPSGTGKTTLLRLITGLLKPDQGEIVVNGKQVSTLNRSGLYELRKDLGMLFQNGALFTDMTVYDNVAFALHEHTRLPERIIRDIVLMKLECVGLRGAKDLMPRELSGGMNRRVALARSLALDPDIILYDEPFTGQDPISMGVLIRLIKRLHDALNMTSVIVSHDIAETASIADYIYLIAEGRVIGEGTPEELKRSSKPEVKQFMNGEPDGPVPFHYPAPPYRDELLGGQA